MIDEAIKWEWECASLLCKVMPVCVIHAAGLAEMGRSPPVAEVARLVVSPYP